MMDLLGIAENAQAWVLMLAAAVGLGIFAGLVYASLSGRDDDALKAPSRLRSFCLFFYASFLKPHTGDGHGYEQQDALESFYKSQASVYDATRKRLLRGREDMLAMVAAQLAHRTKLDSSSTKPIWVDVRINQQLFHRHQVWRITSSDSSSLDRRWDRL